jgi:uncharacterized protein YbaP (TraB family)
MKAVPGSLREREVRVKILRCAAALALALAGAPALSFEAPPTPAEHSSPPRPTAALADANPALWVVRDADTTIYLFGTFHLLDGRPWFNDEVRTAFDASDELVMEAILPENPASVTPMIMRYAVDPNHRKLSDRLTRAQNAALGRALTAAGLPPTAFDSFEPWFAAMTLAVLGAQRLGVTSGNGPETILSNAARERHIPIGELEGLEWQIRLFDGMPEAQQLAQLRETLSQNDSLPSKLAPMLAAWSSGDVARLGRLMDQDERDSPIDRMLHNMMFTTRNANWATWIRNRLARPGTVFIAVGAGHLAGRDSVIGALRARGIQATRVPHVARP